MDVVVGIRVSEPLFRPLILPIFGDVRHSLAQQSCDVPTTTSCLRLTSSIRISTTKTRIKTRSMNCSLDLCDDWLMMLVSEGRFPRPSSATDNSPSTLYNHLQISRIADHILDRLPLSIEPTAICILPVRAIHIYSREVNSAILADRPTILLCKLNHSTFGVEEKEALG